MAMWIEIRGKRYEAVPLDSLTLLQAAKAAREVGLPPERMESVLLEPGGGLDDSADMMAATAVLVWAARVNAGEKHPTVESAQVPMRDINWVNDEPEEEGTAATVDPTPRPPDSGSPEGTSGGGGQNDNSPDSTTSSPTSNSG